MKKAFRDLSPYIWRYRGGAARGLASLVGKDLFAAAIPYVIGRSIDALMHGFVLSMLVRFALLLVCLSVVKGLLQYWMRVILISISRDVEYDIRNDLFARLARLAPDFYARSRTGDIMARATNDLNAVRMMLGPGVMYWTETSLTFVFSIVVMASTDWRLTVLALLPAPLVSIAVVSFGSRIHTRFEKIQAMFSSISSLVQENLAGVRVVRAYAQEEAELRRFEALNIGYIAENLSLAKLSALFMPVLQALISMTFLIVLWAGGARVLAHRITLGNFVMFNTYMGTLVWPMIALGWVVNLMQRGTASWERIAQLMAEEPTIRKPEKSLALKQPVDGGLHLENVSVRYSGGSAALTNVDLLIPAGSTAAIVGHTGSGKTTLVNLIPRLLDPSEGRVLLDGQNLRHLDPAELRRQIGFVPQETYLFSATLAENIAWGVPDATREQIGLAAALAGLAPDLAGFPRGLDTVVGERGLTLSGGQKQRTAIARAVLRNPRILILDDALSSVDTLTEEKILQGLADVMRGRTTILISHRVSTVRNADRIFVLEGGELVESGSHAELVAGGGYYADLYQKQLLEEELEAI
jgi:ATP-binding cassette subfamily B multidrug efflux pump